MPAATNYREQYAQYKRYFTTLSNTYGEKPVVRTSVELVLTLLTVSFFAVFAIRPTVLTVAQLFSDVRQQQQKIKKPLQEKVQNLKTAQDVATRESRSLSLLDQALPRGPKPDLLLRQIEGLATQYGVVIESLSIGKLALFGNVNPTKATGEKYSSFEVSFLVGGSYNGTHAFLKELEEIRRVVNITSISYRPSSEEGESNVIILAAGAQVPYYPEKKEVK